MSNHEYFRELSSLSAIGQLSFEEDQELSQHLRECAECSEAHVDYVRVIRHELPLADAIRSRVRSAVGNAPPSVDLRDRFWARARAEGLEFSPAVEHVREGKSTLFFWNNIWRPAFSLIAVGGLLILGTTLSSRYRVVPRPSAVPEAAANVDRESVDLRFQLAGIRHTLDANAAELTRMKQQKSLSEQALKKLNQSLAETRARAEQLEIELEREEANARELAASNHENEVKIADLNAKDEKLQDERQKALLRAASLETRIDELSSELRDSNAAAQRQEEFLAHDRDIRDLMGARKLYVAEVYDSDENGRTKKPYARVFYTKDKSLIFYGFDLDKQPGLKNASTFQVWGRRGPNRENALNLGILFQDSATNKRWIMKIDDPMKLEQIDAVFVTIEPKGGSSQPTGKPLLFAYLRVDPNHP